MTIARSKSIADHMERKRTREETRARNRAYHGYIRNALEPTSAAIYDDVTIAEVKRMAREWADSAWQDYLDG